MPSYGSLQQAVKVRPGRGETEVGPGRVVLFLPPRSGASVAAESGQHQPSPALRLSWKVCLRPSHMEACRNVGGLFACSLNCIPLLPIPVQSKHTQDSRLHQGINHSWPTTGLWARAWPRAAWYRVARRKTTARKKKTDLFYFRLFHYQAVVCLLKVKSSYAVTATKTLQFLTFVLLKNHWISKINVNSSLPVCHGPKVRRYKVKGLKKGTSETVGFLPVDGAMEHFLKNK